MGRRRRQHGARRHPNPNPNNPNSNRNPNPKPNPNPNPNPNQARGGTCWNSIYERREELQTQCATHP